MLFDEIQTFIADLETTLIAVSASLAVIGIMGLGIMYLGSSLPLIASWKQSNPKAFENVTWGLIFIIFAAGGGVAALLGT